MPTIQINPPEIPEIPSYQPNFPDPSGLIEQEIYVPEISVPSIQEISAPEIPSTPTQEQSAPETPVLPISVNTISEKTFANLIANGKPDTNSVITSGEVIKAILGSSSTDGKTDTSGEKLKGPKVPVIKNTASMNPVERAFYEGTPIPHQGGGK